MRCTGTIAPSFEVRKVSFSVVCLRSVNEGCLYYQSTDCTSVTYQVHIVVSVPCFEFTGIFHCKLNFCKKQKTFLYILYSDF